VPPSGSGPSDIDADSFAAPPIIPPPSLVASEPTICPVKKTFVVEDLGIEGKSPSVTSDDLTLVYVGKDELLHESKRQPGEKWKRGPALSVGKFMHTARISANGLTLDFVATDIPNIKQSASVTTRTARSSAFGAGARPTYPAAHLPVWHHFTLSSGATYYADAWTPGVQVVRNGVQSTVLPATVGFNVSENERILHHQGANTPTTFVDTRLVSYRASAADPFSAASDITSEFALGPQWSKMAVTWVSNDDCIVYGAASTWNYEKSEDVRHIFRGERK